MARAVEESGVERLPGAGADVEVVRRVGRDASWLFVINHGSETAVVPVTGTELISGLDVHPEVQVITGSVAIVREKRS